MACARWAFAVTLLAGAAIAADLEFDEYVQRADAAIRRGDWESAASQFAQAINHADLPKDAAIRGAMHLGYGRAIGVMCHYDEAEKYLLRAKEIAEKAGRAAFPVGYELGSISVARKKYTAATDYFSQLMPIIEREAQAKGSPAMVADAYEKYAVALAANGKPDEAESLRREAGKIRETGPKALPGAITPYGTQCPKS